jgi:hypothetical protein
MSCNSCSNVTLPGVVGPAGAVGPPGAAGSIGPSSTITVGTVTSGSPAAVVNVGTTGAAIFDFTIPTGAQGVSGTTVIHNNVSIPPTTQTVNPFALMDTAVLSTGELISTGDMLVCDIEFMTNNPLESPASAYFIVSIETGGSDQFLLGDALPQFSTSSKVRLYIIKDGATSVNVRYDVLRKATSDYANDESILNSTAIGLLNDFGKSREQGSITVDFSTYQYDIHVYGKTANASFPLKLSRFTVTKYLA